MKTFQCSAFFAFSIISPWDQGQIGIKWETKYAIYQKLTFFFVEKGYPWEQAWKCACKFVFYRLEHNAKGGSPCNWILKVLKWKNGIKSNGLTQIVNETNGIICLVIMFTPRVIVIKMSKIVHFLYFLLMTAKKQSQKKSHFWRFNDLDSEHKHDN